MLGVLSSTTAQHGPRAQYWVRLPHGKSDWTKIAPSRAVKFYRGWVVWFHLFTSPSTPLVMATQTREEQEAVATRLFEAIQLAPGTLA